MIDLCDKNIWLRIKTPVILITLFINLLSVDIAFSKTHQKPELVVQDGHIREIHQVEFSRDGKILASIGFDGMAGEIKIWSVSSGELIRTIKTPTERVFKLCDNGKSLIVQSGYKEDENQEQYPRTRTVLIKKISISTGEAISEFDIPATSVVFSDDCALLAIPIDGTIQVRSFDDGKLIQSFKESGNTEVGNKIHAPFAFNKDNSVLTTSYCSEQRYSDYCKKYTMNLWGVKSGKQITSIKDVLRRPFCFSDDGSLAATGGYDNTVNIWKVETGKLLRTFEGNTDNIGSVVFSHDGKTVISGGGGKDPKIRIWSVATGELLNTLEGHAATVNSLDINGDGTILASAGDDRIIRLWSIATGETIHALKRHSDVTTRYAITNEGKTVVWAGGSDMLVSEQNNLSLFDDDSIKILSHDSGDSIKVCKGSKSSINFMTVSPDGTQAAYSGFMGNQVLRIRDLRTCEPIDVPVDFYIDQLLSYSPDGKVVAALGYLEKKAVVGFVSASSGNMIRTVEAPSIFRSVVEFGPGWKTFAISNGSQIEIRNVETGALINTFGSKDDFEWFYSLVFSPDGNLLASGVGLNPGVRFMRDPNEEFINKLNTIKIWDVSTGKLIQTLKGGNSIIGFGNDGKTIVSYGYDGLKYVWDISSGDMLRTIKEELNPQQFKIRFNAPATKDVFHSTGLDYTMQFWDGTSGKTIATFWFFGDSDWIVESPDGYIECTEGAKQYIRWRLNNKLYPAEKYINDFYRKGLLSSLMEQANYNVR